MERTRLFPNRARLVRVTRQPKPREPIDRVLMLFAAAALLGLNLCLATAAIGYFYDTPGQSPAARQSTAADGPPVPSVEGAQPPIRVGPPLREEVRAPEPAATGPLPAGVVNILLLGKDERPGEIETGAAGRTDTMMVLRIDFDNRRAKLLAFPRDMVVALPHLESHGIEAGKINTAYHYGELYDLPGGGPQAAMDTVTLNFGIPVDHYVVVDFQGFVDTVDALGGIDIDVPEAIHDYEFPTDDYGLMELIVAAGPQRMDGLTALRYARTRHQDNDVERIKRQQLVLLAIRERALSADALRRAPDIYDAISKSIETDMSPAALISYGLAAQQIERSDISTYVMENAAIDEWAPDPGAGVYVPRRSKNESLIRGFMAVP